VTARLEGKIETIMGGAYQQAWNELRREIHKMMRRNPRRFKTFWMAVGWGPTFLGPDDKTVHAEQMNKRERKLDAYITEFYDRYGGNNARIDI
jgi:hypothetical protein